jgi:hypothetical protein
MFTYVSEEYTALVFKIEDRGRMFLEIISKHLPEYTASHDRIVMLIVAVMSGRESQMSVITFISLYVVLLYHYQYST